jgi:uncharacterized protein with PIN domain
MIRLYLDEDVHKKIALALRLKGYDVISAHEVKNWGISDKEQLDYSILKKRAIFTFNTRDFSLLHEEYEHKKIFHYGIILSKQIPLKQNISKIINFMYLNKQADITNKILWI